LFIAGFSFCFVQGSIPIVKGKIIFVKGKLQESFLLTIQMTKNAV
jgi:hypothetical protein